MLVLVTSKKRTYISELTEGRLLGVIKVTPAQRAGKSQQNKSYGNEIQIYFILIWFIRAETGTVRL